MVKKRIKLGLLFGVDSKWIAGSYYLMNLVHALNSLPDEQKPHIVFLSNDKNKFIIEQLNYPYYSILNPYNRKRNYFEAAINKLYKFFKKKDFIIKKINDKHIDLLFPANFDEAFSLVSKKIFWIPDFQHHYYPNYFTAEELKLRNDLFTKISNLENHMLVLSSNNAKADFNKFYSNAKIQVFVVPFAVTHPYFQLDAINEVLSKYSINKPYFIVANQFWQHKNHLIVLKALKYLKQSHNNLPFQIVFTGKGDDYRAPGFYQNLLMFINENKLQDDVKLVGFIDRDEQLLLMKKALAVIQPSLFEGWSTVVEDAKSLNQFVILSGIEVHREQIKENVQFFLPHDFKKLAEILHNFYEKQPEIKKLKYQDNIQKFGENFQYILTQMMK